MTVKHDLTVATPATAPLIPTSPEAPKKKGPGRPPIQHGNRFVRLWLRRWLGMNSSDSFTDEDGFCIIHSPSIYQMPDWCHDVIVGAARLNNSENYTGLPMNTSTIIKILLELDELTNASVKEFMESLGRKKVSRQYGQQMASAAIAASKSIDYHLGMREKGLDADVAWNLAWEGDDDDELDWFGLGVPRWG
ncbi:hypothetical protein D3C85_1083320 [compost metagenome]